MQAPHFVHVDWPKHFNEVPKDIFYREDVYRLELKRLFYGPQWHPLAHLSEIPNPGDFKTASIGESPMLVVHGKDAVVRVFENACSHRATQLATSSRGSAEKFECPYHRWTFSTAGELLGCPGRSDFPENFEPEKHGLKELRSGLVHGLVFATYSDEVADLEVYLGTMKDALGRALGGDGKLRLLGYQKVMFDSNWKAYNDNEGYHAPLLHSAFRLMRWKGGAGTQTMTANAHKTINVELKVPEAGFLNDQSLVECRDTRTSPQSIIVTLFPLAGILKHLDVINIRYAFPHGPDRTEVHYAYFSHQSDDEALSHHRMRQASNLLGPSGLISLEDGAVFNRIHTGSHTLGTVGFQKGVTGDSLDPMQQFRHNDEAGNLVRWDEYRRCMGF